MVKVSVIIPIYNVEAYLEKCLESLINQTLEDIEIIAVNDGSTDGSQNILDKYMKRTSKLKCYIKENGGLSDARNYGFTYAKGEYIGFVDSDDFVETDMYEIMYKKAKEEDSDIVECNLRHTYPDKEDIEIGKKIYDKKEMLMFGRSVVWNKIYKRDWLCNTNVIFPKGLIYEDVEFFIMLVPHIRNYSYVDEASIHYVQRSSSINNMSSIKTLDILSILKNIYNYYFENGYLKEYEEALEFFYARILLCSSFSRMCHIRNRRNRKKALRENWKLLIDTFPNWRSNSILKKQKSHQGLFMRTMNPLSYTVYSYLFPILYQLSNRLSRKWD